MSQAGTSFRGYLKELNLDKNRTQEAQRIATLPEKELAAAFARAADDGSMLSVAGLRLRLAYQGQQPILAQSPVFLGLLVQTPMMG